MNADEVAARLGQAYRSGGWWRCRCPVHSSAGATLALKDGNWGLIAHCHAGCRRTDVMTELRRRGFLDAGSSKHGPAIKKRGCEAEDADRRRRIALAMDIWRTSYPARGTIVEAYLLSRGLTMPVPPTLRMHGLMRHRESGERRPAMVGLVEHSEAGRVGVHITYVNPLDPSVKVSLEPRKRLIGPVAGAAIRLAEVRPDRALIVGEGIEFDLVSDAASRVAGMGGCQYCRIARAGSDAAGAAGADRCRSRREWRWRSGGTGCWPTMDA